MSGVLRLIRSFRDRLSPETVDGAGKLSKFGAAEASDGSRRVDLKRFHGLVCGGGADAELVDECGQSVGDGLVGAEELLFGEGLDEAFGGSDGEKALVGWVHAVDPGE